jgi:hypothetical protein
MQGKVFLQKHFNNRLPDGSILTFSETGYINDQLCLEWIRHFDKGTKDPIRHPIQARLLIMDGHGSHLTFEFMDICKEANIILFLLPLHSTHLLQPLDIGIFQGYKHYH